MRSQLDYGDIIYDTSGINIKPIQYNAELAVTGAVRGTSREKLHQELTFVESLPQRHWYRKLSCLFKIFNNQSPSYPFQLVPSPNTRYITCNSGKIKLFQELLFPLKYKRMEQSRPRSQKI